jgi:hypothetical protein
MRIGIAGVALAASLVGIAACGPSISTDYNSTVPLTQFHTFAMVSQPDSVSHQLVDQRVAQAVQSQLTAKGLTPADRANADLYVGYGVVDRTRKEVYSTADNWGWGGGWGWRYHRWGVAWPITTRRQVETYTDGTVVVNLVDAKTHQVVWQSEAAHVLTLPVSNPTSATHAIDGAVSSMFSKYPAAPVSTAKAGT